MPQNHSDNGRLDSWKKIAVYLDRDIRTVMRWEREKELPVHRVPGGKRQAIFAYTDEINAWLLGQTGKSDNAADSDREMAVQPHPPTEANAHSVKVMQAIPPLRMKRPSQFRGINGYFLPQLPSLLQ
ncbi:MAG: hypothetical protein ACJ71U_15645 [Terriglobales bacterium]